jgi:hypothetical protein
LTPHNNTRLARLRLLLVHQQASAFDLSVLAEHNNARNAHSNSTIAIAVQQTLGETLSTHGSREATSTHAGEATLSTVVEVHSDHSMHLHPTVS